MLPLRRHLAAAIVLTTCCLPLATAHKKSTIPAVDEHDRALQALNRLTFGPRPGDVDRVLAIGVDQWIDQQLHPDTIADHALDARLSPFRTLHMSTEELERDFPAPAVIRQVAEGKLAMPTDPERRAVYEQQLALYRVKLEKKTGQAEPMETPPADGAADKHTEMLTLAPDLRMQALLTMAPEDRSGFLMALKGDPREQFLNGMSAEQREEVMAMISPLQVVTDEMVQARLLRAAYSERQLQEVMTDFWLNHFNVFIGKSADRYELISFERDVIRPRALGKFEDLLKATAQSPAMLFYLDNWLSVGPNSDFANGVRHPGQERRRNLPVQQAKGSRAGLNENYGRELMELHTLGVNGGYTQKDVTEVARVLTGWTLKEPRQGGGFDFEERMHEPGDKHVLGHRIKSGGEKEGREVLHILAHHPATAKFISTKLAMRFVSDDPPPALIDRMTQTFLKKNGDISEVLRTMFGSPEFWATDSYRAKVKTPLEFVVSAVRTSGAEVSDAMPLAHQLQNFGMPLYGMQPPTGYSMKADAWVNSSALLGRMNFALALTAGKLKGVQVDPGQMLGAGASPTDSQGTLAALENSLLAGNVSRQTHDTIAAQMNDPKINQRRLDDPASPPNTGAIAGLLLGSPEFQRR